MKLDVQFPDAESEGELVPVKKLRTAPVSEIFFSIEGEGILTGFPTVFVRTFGCNFTCSGFSKVPGEAPTEHVVTIQKLEDFVPLNTGCDSVYSWNKNYKQFTKKYTATDMVKEIKSLVPLKHWKDGKLKPVLSLTGGEPTLHQKFWVDFLKNPFLKLVDKILFETNGALTLTDEFTDALKNWIETTGGTVLWANSPKLSASGEAFEDAIRPDVIAHQREVSTVQYFKFVTDGTPESLEEIRTAISWYEDRIGHPIEPAAISLMPMGATKEQQEVIQRKVALLCMEHGYVFCARTHLWVFDGTAIGT